MSSPAAIASSRILIVDDNPSIHRDFKLVLLAEGENRDLEEEESRLFAGRAVEAAPARSYELGHAYSGQEAIDTLQKSVAEEKPFQVAFVDVRMPGIDGVETVSRLWEVDGRLQVILCTAYSDYSWSDLARRLGTTDKLLVLKKPFDNIEVTQLASTLVEKWHLALQANLKLEEMELLVSRRTQKLFELLRRQEQEAPVQQPSLRSLDPGSGEAAMAKTDAPVVLLVSTDAAIGSGLKQFAPEYQIVAVETAEEGFNSAREAMPDVVVAELCAAAIDGLALCQRLKADELVTHIPLLMLGSRAEENSHIKALEAGADDCLVRPFTAQLLKARIEHLVRSRGKALDFRALASVQPREVAVSQLDAQFLRRAMNTVETFLSDFEFDVDVFARKMAMSRRQLFRKLKAVAGCTPNGFIRTLRLNRAAWLLLHSQMTVTEITYGVGFSDLKHFRTVFREAFGVLPGDYTAQHSANFPLADSPTKTEGQ